MPSVDQLKEHAAKLVQRRDDRKRGRHRELSLLPPDLTGTVLIRCREEAADIRDWLEEVDAEIEKVEGQIADAKLEVREACAVAMRPAKVHGDILFGYEVEPARPEPNWLQLTPAALAIRKKKVQPLERRLEMLKRERFQRGQELGELRRIATLAGLGRIGLIHHLSKKWAGRLEIGGAVEGYRAKLKGTFAMPSDFAGNPLPPEALDAEDEPDMSMSGQRVQGG